MSCRDRERQQGYHAVGRRNDIRDRAQALIDVGGANGGQLLTRPCPVRTPVPLSAGCPGNMRGQGTRRASLSFCLACHSAVAGSLAR